ncbi:MAG: hypothetical protein WA902_18675, partial [Thermosynechococcaceae cyanobacterium]
VDRRSPEITSSVCRAIVFPQCTTTYLELTKGCNKNQQNGDRLVTKNAKDLCQFCYSTDVLVCDRLIGFCDGFRFSLRTSGSVAG